MWYRLSEELLKVDDAALNQLFRPYVERLIAVLCTHCQLDEDTSLVSVQMTCCMQLYDSHCNACFVCLADECCV